MVRRALPDPRVKDMVHLYTHGTALEDIGNEYGLTRERIRQILKKAGVSGKDGGKSIKMLLNLRYKQKKAPSHSYFETYGCTREEAEILNGGLFVSTKGSPARMYGSQRSKAIHRKIEWRISFPDWMRIWKESGKLEQRGRGTGYCMARFGDSGPYSAENVEIITASQNASDSYLIHSWHERFGGIDFHINRTLKTHCLRGHERTPETVFKNGDCKECKLLRNKLVRAKQREAL